MVKGRASYRLPHQRDAANDLKARQEVDSVTDSSRLVMPEGLAAPALRALAEAEITTLDDLRFVTESELLAMHGIGPRAIRIIQMAFNRRGWTLQS